jgi:predicted nucleotidyltransferase
MTSDSASADPRVLAAIQDIVLAACPEVEAVVLFGSRAAGTAKPDSDYDFLIVMPEGADYTSEETLEYLHLCAGASAVQASIDLTVATLAEIEADPSSVAFAAFHDGTVLIGMREQLPAMKPAFN